LYLAFSAENGEFSGSISDEEGALSMFRGEVFDVFGEVSVDNFERSVIGEGIWPWGALLP
jgi:hypothetical protein